MLDCRLSCLVLLLAPLCSFEAVAAEPRCPGGSSPDPAVLFCDDFDGEAPQAGPDEKYFEYDRGAENLFVPVAGVGVGGSKAMRAHWSAGQLDGSALRILFGRVPKDGYRVTNIHPDTDFREIYWRQYLKMHEDWTGGHPYKLSRAFSFGSPDHWGQAMIGHLWHGPELFLDPASGIKEIEGVDTLVATQYNDGANLKWLGNARGKSPIYTEAYAGKWFCIEAHIQLNTPGLSDGLFEYWIDDGLEARRKNLNWVRSWQDYAINAVYFENYTNGGSPVERERYFDNLVIASERIGCLASGAGAAAPDPPNATGVALLIFLAAGALSYTRRSPQRRRL